MQLDIVGGCLKCTLLGLQLYCCHGNSKCLLMVKNVIFNSETVVKSAKCVALFLKSIKTLQPKTWSRYNTIILVYVIELPLPQILSSQMDLIVNCHNDVFQENFIPLK